MADGPTAAEAEAAYEQIKAIFATCAGDDEIGRRLARADTTIEITISDAPGSPLVVGVRLDRVPIEVTDGPLPHAEVRLRMRVTDMLSLWLGEIHPAMAIVEGHASYEGPVRKLLRVVPILRDVARPLAQPTSLDRSRKP